MSVRLGTSAFTSRMTFGFEPASKDSSFTLNTVFSFGFSCGMRITSTNMTKMWGKGDSRPQVHPLQVQPRRVQQQQPALQFLGCSALSKPVNLIVSYTASEESFSTHLQLRNKVGGLKQRQTGNIVHNAVNGNVSRGCCWWRRWRRRLRCFRSCC